MKCHYCETTEALRPYGPGGSPICFPCMKATPERERQAENIFGTLLEAAETLSPTGTAVIGFDSGPAPWPGRGRGRIVSRRPKP